MQNKQVLGKIEGWKRNHASVCKIDKNGYIEVDRVLYDNETFDIGDNGTINIGKKTPTPDQIAFFNSKNEFKYHCSNTLGGYVNMIYANNEILFNELNIDKANISRIIYLATYLDYNNREKGLLVNQSRDKDGTYSTLEPMTKKDIQKALGLTDSTFKRFFKDMKDNSIIFEANDKFYINPDYFTKGEVDKEIKKNKNYCRLFINTIRDLYEGCKTSQHKVLSSIYQLIPFVHYEHNIVCHNPQEPTQEPKGMTLNEICDLLGINNDKGNRSNFAKKLYQFKLNLKGQEYHLFSYVIVNADYDYFVVNPLVIYSGNNLESIMRTSRAMFFNSRTHRQKRK